MDHGWCYSIASRPPPDHQSDAFQILSRELFCACHSMNRKRLSAYLFPPVKVSWAHLIHLWTFSRFHIPSPFIYHTVSLSFVGDSFPSHHRQFVVIHKLRGMIQSSSYLGSVFAFAELVQLSQRTRTKCYRHAFTSHSPR